MYLCRVCGDMVNDPHYCEGKGREVRREDETQPQEAGEVGIAFDPSCGSVEPSISLGGGIGIGMDGHLTIGPFGF